MRARRLPVMVAVLLAAAFGWWLLGHGNRRSTEESPGDSEPQTEAPPGLASRPGKTGSDAGGEPLPVVHPPLESLIEGTVRRDGRPAAARVELRRKCDEPPFADGRRALDDERIVLRVAEAGEDGRFSFSDVASGTYVLRAVARDGAVGRTFASISAPGSRDVAEISLGASASLRGRVTHADGTPWRGSVLVLAGSHEWPPACVGAVEVDAGGRFVVEGLPAAWVVACAVAPEGGHVFGESVRLPSADEQVIVWEGNRVAVTGRVLTAAGGAPIAGAEVVGEAADPHDLLASVDRVRTDADGRFRVLVPTRDGVVVADAPGYASARAAVADPSQEVEVLLGRAARIRGLVRRRGGGGPVAGAEVRMLLGPESESGFAGSFRADDQGRFVVEDVRPGSYVFFARGAGHVSAAFLPSEAAARSTVRVGAGDDVEAVIETVTGARVVGRVIDADGSAVEGATVTAKRDTRSRDGEADRPHWLAYGWDVVSTSRGGVYEIDSLVPGDEYVVSASAPGRPDTPERRLLAAAEAPGRVDLAFPRGRWVDVTVIVKGTETPVADAWVDASTSPDRYDGDDGVVSSKSEASGRTDGAGRVRLGPLGPGEIRVDVEAEGFADMRSRERLDVVEVAGGLTATVWIEKGRSISGRVLRPDGQPAAGATVWLMEKDRSGTGRRSGEDGTFAFDDIKDGEYTLRATLDDGGLASEEIPAPLDSTGVTLRLAARSVFARVLDADGNPVPKARASYYPGGGSGHRVENGRLAIEVEGDDHTVGVLTITEATGAGGQRLPLGEARVEGVRPGREVVVRLPRERTIEGRVLGPDGQGVAGVRVRAERIHGDPSDWMEGWMEDPRSWWLYSFVRTDASGSFRVGHLGEGPHFVAVLPPPAYAPPATVRRDAGATGVDFRLRPSASATVTVVGPTGKAVADARVVAVKNMGQPSLIDALFSDSGSGWAIEAETGADGRVRLEGFDLDATFIIGVRAPPTVSLADAVKTSWRPADTTIRLEPGLAVSGAATDEAGNPLRAWIDCREANGASRSVQTSEDGTFGFTGLAAGTVRLDARSEHGRDDSKVLRASTSVQAGTEGVQLRLR